MELLTQVTTLAEVWALGYKLRRVPGGKDLVDRRTMFGITAPDGHDLGYAHTDCEVFSAVNPHRQTTPGGA